MIFLQCVTRRLADIFEQEQKRNKFKLKTALTILNSSSEVRSIALNHPKTYFSFIQQNFAATSNRNAMTLMTEITDANFLSEGNFY